MCALCEFKLEHYSLAIEYCKKSSSLNPDKKENYLLLTECYLNLDDKDNCLNNFEKYEDKLKDDWKFYNAWGASFQHFNMFENAVEKYNKALELNNQEYIIYNALSYCYVKLDKIDEALNAINKVLELNPAIASAHFNLGQIYMKKNEYKKAIDSYKKAISIDANLSNAYFGIAGAYQAMGDYKNAVKYWKKSAEYDTQNPDLYLNLAVAYMNELNNESKALSYIRTAYDLNRENSDILFKYGIILYKTGEIYRAKEKFEKAYLIDSTLDSAKIAHAECELRLKKPEISLEILEKCSEQSKDKKDYLTVKMLSLYEIYINNPENNENYSTIIEICDKIRNDYGEDSVVKEIAESLSGKD